MVRLKIPSLLLFYFRVKQTHISLKRFDDHFVFKKYNSHLPLEF